MNRALRIFVGHDSRENLAYSICVRSMQTHATRNELDIAPISFHTLGERTYRRPTELRGPAYWDCLSSAPMSTQFSIARFFIPLVAREGWALFCDCDFLWRADVAELFALADERYAVMVVKNAHNPVEVIKMDGAQQTAYRRKNWSSLMLLNCAAPEVQALDAQRLNTMTKHALHGFDWVPDERIGALPPAWNWLVGISPKLADPRAAHFTLGTPDMRGYEDSAYADEWREYARW